MITERQLADPRISTSCEGRGSLQSSLTCSLRNSTPYRGVFDINQSQATLDLRAWCLLPPGQATVPVFILGTSSVDWTASRADQQSSRALQRDRHRAANMSVLGQSMDDLLPKLLAFPPHPPPQTPLSDFQYDEGIRNQISTVGKIPEKNLLPQTSGGENALDVSFYIHMSVDRGC